MNQTKLLHSLGLHSAKKPPVNKQMTGQMMTGAGLREQGVRRGGGGCLTNMVVSEEGLVGGERERQAEIWREVLSA